MDQHLFSLSLLTDFEVSKTDLRTYDSSFALYYNALGQTLEIEQYAKFLYLKINQSAPSVVYGTIKMVLIIYSIR